MRQSPDNAKHTPGPWHCHNGAVYMRPFPDTSGCIANMDREEPETAPWERDANARLIASAPELLEALKVLESWLGAFLDRDEQLGNLDMRLVGQARAVIAKAEGSEVPRV